MPYQLGNQHRKKIKPYIKQGLKKLSADEMWGYRLVAMASKYSFFVQKFPQSGNKSNKNINL